MGSSVSPDNAKTSVHDGNGVASNAFARDFPLNGTACRIRFQTAKRARTVKPGAGETRMMWDALNESRNP
jgi:hypothetical protein